MNSVIETNRLILRELTPDDAADLSLVLSDEESMVHYPHAFSAEEVQRWIDRNMERYRTNGFGLWAVVRKSDNQFIGDCGITLQNINGEILPEIGFHTIKHFCSRGYATEAAEACKEYAIRKLGFTTIYSYSRESNVASQKVAAKIGMQKIKAFKQDDVPIVVYSVNAVAGE
jgi:RimJ/RimL family protein N-acetyltransferase